MKLCFFHRKSVRETLFFLLSNVRNFPYRQENYGKSNYMKKIQELHRFIVFVRRSVSISLPRKSFGQSKKNEIQTFSC